MKLNNPKGWFVTGTDTEVGKTMVTGELIHYLVGTGLRVAAMKPVASGCYENEEGLWRNRDAEYLLAASNVASEYKHVNPYAFPQAIAPHLAAARDDTNIDIEVVLSCYQQLQSQADAVVVEGVGGWQAPLNQEQTLADLASLLDLPVVLVVGMRLGCLNHALLTAASIKYYGANLVGWVANSTQRPMFELEANIRTLRSRLPAPCLGIIPYKTIEIMPGVLSEHLDWSLLFG
ncbi:MAG: dethiobiotin synthase [Gammaproteobacteria bacterium]|nr:MAG: dethiobiotin synthase [Gammaproteobacteria bacterium]